MYSTAFRFALPLVLVGMFAYAHNVSTTEQPKSAPKTKQAVRLPDDLRHATGFVRLLRDSGLTVKSVRRSIYDSIFEGTDETGAPAVWIETDKGIVEAVFFPKPEAAKQVQVETIAKGEGGRYKYAVREGPNEPARLLDGNRPYYFVAIDRMFILTSAQEIEKKIQPKKRNENPASIVGAWDASDRHHAMGSLYQPNHGVRQREATVYIKQDGDRLTGYSITPQPKGITGQDAWNGRTEFRTVSFADGQLVFEFDIDKIAHGRDRRVVDKGTIRVEAKLMDGRLVGKWGVFLKDGTEPFRGEWEAVRVEMPEKK